MVFRLSKSLVFPDPALAEADGLLAVGGDLSSERLMLAYENGIFPWYSDGDPICWYSPHERFILLPEAIHISRSMQRLMRGGKYTITENKAFNQVIAQCSSVPRAGQDGTWITADMKAAYITLHKKGLTQSVEIWHQDELIGGIYGVVRGRVFCGESMFSLMPSASKLTLIYLCQSGKYDLIDCQFHTPHLESMGGSYISRDEYMSYLHPSKK